MPAAPRVKLPIKTGGAVRTPASPANPGPRGPRNPADPILRLAREQKRQLSDREMQAARQIDNDWQRLVAVPLGVELSRFADRYQQALDALAAAQDDGSGDDAEDFGPVSAGSPTSPANPGRFGPRSPVSPANPGARGGANPGRFAGSTGASGGDTVPSTWLLDAHGGDAHGLLRSARGQITKFAQATQKTIAHAAADASAQGMTDGQQLLAIALQPLVNASGGELDPEDFLQAGVAAARKDARFALLSQLMNAQGPLAQLLGSMPQESADQAYRTLLYGLGHGENPQALVTDLQQILNSSRSRALTISRTEMMNAYRGAQIDNYRANSDVVQGWIWLADLGSSCPLCTDLNGEIHPLDDDMVSHPRCRCSPGPYTKSWDDILSPVGISADELGLEDTSLQVESGEDWFARQDEATQRAILGPAAFNAYQGGALQLSDLVGRNPDGSYYQKSMKEAGLDANAWLGRGPNAGMPVRVEIPGGGYTYVTPGPLSEEVPQFNTEGREAGWQGVDEEMAGLRGETAAGLGTVEEIQAREAEWQELFDQARANGDAWANNLQQLADKLVDNPAFQPIIDKYIGDQAEYLMGYTISREDAAYRSVGQLLEGYHTYVGGSSSASPLQIALQEAAREEFGLTSAAATYSAAAREAALAEYADQMDGLRAFVRQMYDNTQADLAERGITEIQVFRGMSFTEAQLPSGLTLDGSLQSDEFALQPISSFSTSLNTAMQYANGTDFGALAGDYGAVLATVIPADQILSTGFTGFGAFYMQEVTTLGGAYDMLIIGSEHPSFTLDDLYTALSGSE